MVASIPPPAGGRGKGGGKARGSDRSDDRMRHPGRCGEKAWTIPENSKENSWKQGEDLTVFAGRVGRFKHQHLQELYLNVAE